MDARRAFGNRAELLVETMLRSKGYEILARQYRTRFGEIDLVARDGDEVVFVEVKARKKSLFGYPEESVDYRKRGKILKTAQVYLAKIDPEPNYRFDIVAVEYETSPPTVRHYVNIEVEM